MFGQIFRRRAAPHHSPARAPAGQRIYVVGDIHGRLDLLQAMAGRVAADLADGTGAVAKTYFLGDLIDRGPDSAGVIELLSRGAFPTPVMALRGNHEDMLLRFLDNPSALEDWRKFGGLETLHAYGAPVADAMRGTGYAAARDALAAAMPAHHRAFLERAPLSVDLGDYFLCHAGVRPGRPFEAQEADDLLWIREPFLKFEGDFGKIVVHGHTPVEAPDVRANRINIDTGAYASSILTALALEDERRRFISTAPGP